MHCWGFKIIFCVTKKTGWRLNFDSLCEFTAAWSISHSSAHIQFLLFPAQVFFFFWKGGRDVATLQMKCQHCLNWSPWQILMQYIMAQAMPGRGWAPMCHHYDRWFLNILNVNGFVAKALKIVHLMYLFDSIC